MGIIRKIFFSKKTLAALPIIAAVFLFSAQPAAAWSLVGFALDSVGLTIANILYTVILSPLAGILGIMGNLVNYGIQPHPLTSSQFVLTGWGAMRDLTNMLFMLVLLGIALDFILFNSFGVKKMLVRLLVIALFINFTLPIAGVVLDFANAFTTFFIDSVGSGGYTTALGSRIDLANVFSADSIEAAANAAEAQRGALLDILFAIVFVFGTLLVFIALAVMFFIRHFALSILLIVSPLALIASVIPSLQSHWSSWKSSFLKWTMFAPACAFFLYLSVVFLDSTQNFSMGSITAAAGNGDSTGLLATLGTKATTYIFAWMLIIMSLTTAQRMGIAGASVAVSSFNKANKWTKGKLGSVGKRGLAAAGRRTKADEQVEKLAQGLRNLPGLGGVLSSGVRGVGVKTRLAMEKQEGLTQQQKANYEKYSDELLKKEYATFSKSVFPGDKAKAAQIAEMLARKGSLNVIDEHSGIVDPERTAELVKEAYASAKIHKNRAAMDGIMKANPIVYQDIAREEWQDLASKDKLSGVRFSKDGRIIAGRRKDTGETFEDAQNKAFERMTSTDFENLKGSWNADAARLFLFSGAMGSNHIRMASNANDHGFLNNVSSVLEGMSAQEIEALQQKSPSLVSFFKGGQASNFIKVPTSFEKKVEEQKEAREVKEKGGEKTRSSSSNTDEFGRRI